MQRFLLFIVLLTVCIFGYAQKTRYDSIRKELQQDSIEYEQQKRDAERIKQQADSMLNKEFGHANKITPSLDSEEVVKKMKAIVAQELQKKQQEEKKNYYIFVGAFGVLVLSVILLFKRKQFSAEDSNKP
jgi:hypothetical protein